MSLRQVVLDTETTGLSAEEGHRILEIGCVELLDRRSTGRTLHLYINPERDIDAGALAVHGLTRERLRDEPVFAQVAERVADFVAGAQVLIHNAAFDVGFLDAEFARLGMKGLRDWADSVIDTLKMARDLHPGRRNSLDALCERYGVSNAHRVLHGALLDAQLLAEVYLAMTRGQDSLAISVAQGDLGQHGTPVGADWPPVGLRVCAAGPEEREAHEALVAAIAEEIRKPALWSELAQPAQPT